MPTIVVAGLAALVVFGLLAATIVVVGGTTEGRTEYVFEGRLGAPWTEMGLPIGDGTVLVSTEHQVTVTYPTGTVPELATRFDTSLRAVGWTELVRSDDPDTARVVYVQGDAELALAVVESAGTVTVSLTAI